MSKKSLLLNPFLTFLLLNCQWAVALLLFVQCGRAENKQPVKAGNKNSQHPDLQQQDDFMYQYSIMDALMAGVFDGNLPFSQLKTHGDFGIGTFNALDGEMILLDNKVYKMRHNRSVQQVADTDSTPLAFVKYFKADTAFIVSDEHLTYARLQNQLNKLLDKNGMFAVRIKGLFKTMEARSVTPASKPYPELADHIAKGGQTTFKFMQTRGTCVGFLMPTYMARSNVPGYHVHYIADDRKLGGHIFEFTADKLEVEIDRIAGYTITLNTNRAFHKADLDKNREKEVERIE